VPRKFRIELSPEALAALRRVRSQKIRRELAMAIDALARAPEEQGRALSGPLDGCRSIHVSRDRYRIVYRVETTRVVVLIVGRRKAGQTRDVYRVAERLVRILLDRDKR
jgi:addiction module RelE/StbE family toxin